MLLYNFTNYYEYLYEHESYFKEQVWILNIYPYRKKIHFKTCKDIYKVKFNFYYISGLYNIYPTSSLPHSMVLPSFPQDAPQIQATNSLLCHCYSSGGTVAFAVNYESASIRRTCTLVYVFTTLLLTSDLPLLRLGALDSRILFTVLWILFFLRGALIISLK